MTVLHDVSKNPLNYLSNTGLLWVILTAAGMVVFFWLGILSLFEAWSKPEYSHGYLIPIIAVGLFLRVLNKETESKNIKDNGQWIGISVVLIGVIFGYLGNLVNISDIATYGMIITIAGIVLVLKGTQKGLKYWVPVTYLIFMLPLPNFIYWPLSIKLQLISSEIGVWLVTLFGVPVFLDGNIIDLGIYKLQVAEACSGLRYLFPLMSFGFLFAVLYKGPIWHKLIIFLSAAPITILMNSLRIGIIGILVDRYGIEQAEGFLHNFQGWVIFVACIAVLYLEAALLQLFTKWPRPIYDILDLDLGSIAPHLRRVNNIQPTRALIVSSLMIFSVGLAWNIVPARASIDIPRETLALFPTNIGEWQGRGQILDPGIERVLAADDYYLANYESADKKPFVNLFIAFYKSQTDGSGIHSPEVCIPAGGWEISKIRSTEIQLKGGSELAFNVNRAIIQKGTTRQLVYYWFEQRGRRLTSDYAAKVFTVWDTIVMGRSDGALVRVITPLSPGESLDSADERLIGFLSASFPTLHRFVPE